MAEKLLNKRIWGWMFFDWAQQPYATLGLTFIFGPYFAGVAADWYMAANGQISDAASASAQSLWSMAQGICGMFIALSAPFLGAFAEAGGRKKPWISILAVIASICAASLWMLQPDGTGLFLTLTLFWLGFIAAEAAFNLNNALLPDLIDKKHVGYVGGLASSFGYWGGVLSLFIVLLFFAEGETGRTLIGLEPAFGLDAQTRQGTRFVGPFIGLWFLLFLVPFFVWYKSDDVARADRPSTSEVLSRLKDTVKIAWRSVSCRNFLIGSMFYRDALTAMYSYGGIYARLVLGWEIKLIGIFGIIAAISAAIFAYLGGHADRRFGPKPVIRTCCWTLIIVALVIVTTSRDQVLGISLATGSVIPDATFFLCGALLGGAGGVLYSCSRTLMVRHTDPDRAGESFGLFALTGRATAFLAPMLVWLGTTITGNVQLGLLPVIALFLIGLYFMKYVHPEGDRV